MVPQQKLCSPLIYNPLPLVGIIIGILIRRGSINHGSTLRKPMPKLPLSMADFVSRLRGCTGLGLSSRVFGDTTAPSVAARADYQILQGLVWSSPQMLYDPQPLRSSFRAILHFCCHLILQNWGLNTKP